MRVNQVVCALEPLKGMLLRGIVDSDRQEAMDHTLEVIRGWSLEEIGRGEVASPDHPQQVTDVHLRFRTREHLPVAEYVLNVRARDVYRIRHRPMSGDDAMYIRTEILFRRGHVVAVELV